MKKKCALVFGITNNYLFALANTLIGLRDNNQVFWDDIIVYIDSIKDNEVELINKILPTKLVEINSNNYKYLKNKAIEKYSMASFYRFECFKLLNDYETVIWNDVDILIQGDISGLLDYGKESGFAATVTIGNFNVEANFKKLILEYNMFDKLYNSGILVLKDSLKDYDKMYNWCFQKTNEYLSILNWPDQGIINLLIQEFNINVDNIDISKYCCHPSIKKSIGDASIIHTYGDEKFWNCKKLRDDFPKWVQNDIEWQGIVNVKSNSPLVSCVMSTYNRYEFLKEAVDSILYQTYSNLELIIVLEKCENQDKIEELLNAYNDNRIKIIKNSIKLGFAASLNVGIREAKGKYIARMDDDDISLPDRFKIQVDYLEGHPNVGICGTGGEFFGKYSGNIPIETGSSKLKIITLFKTPFIHPTVMMRKDMILKYNLFYDNNYFTEDYELWSRAVNCFDLENINIVLLKYRCSLTNVTSGQNEDKIHTSHKNIMKNQFNKYLHLDLTNNEIEVIQLRKDIITYSDNKKDIYKLRESVLNKIVRSNKQYNYFDNNVLKNVLKNEFSYQLKCKSLLKKIIKKCCYPIYNYIMYRVDIKIIENQKYIIDYIDEKINRLKEDKE